MLLRAKLMAMVGVGIAVMVLGFWLYYKNSQKRLSEAAAQNAQQQIQIQQQQAIQKQMQQDITKGAELRQTVTRQMVQTQRSVDDMRAKFVPRQDSSTGQPVTLGARAVEKTDTVERAVNRGTFDQLRCFELTTGSALTDDEKSGKVSNSLCPELLVFKLPSSYAQLNTSGKVNNEKSIPPQVATSKSGAAAAAK
jgi:hypothetical protein